MTTTGDPPLYDRLGGMEAIEAAVDAFHERVAADDRVNGYFRGVDMAALTRHQADFFAAGTGGPVEYTGAEIAAAHAPLAVDDRAFDVFAEHLEATLVAFGVLDRERGELLDVLNGYRAAVVTD